MIEIEKDVTAVNSISLFATKGDLPCEIDLQWDSVPGAVAYIIQCKKAGTKNSSWKHLDIVNDSKFTASGLRTNIRYAFRIAVITREGQSGWSEPVEKLVEN